MIFNRFHLHFITWQALAVTSGGASTLKAGLSAAPTFSNKLNKQLSTLISIVQLF